MWQNDDDDDLDDMWAELEGDDGEDVVSNNVSTNLLEVSAPHPPLRPLAGPGPVAASTTAGLCCAECLGCTGPSRRTEPAVRLCAALQRHR